MPLDRIDYDVYAAAREVVNSLRFYDGVAISLEPTETAHEIGITQYNFPRIDGAATSLINSILISMYDGEQDEWGGLQGYFVTGASGVIPSYELLIAGKVDMLFVPDPSAHVLSLAADVGVELEFYPIAAEGLVFITSVQNSVSEITTEQILQIFMERSITNWAEIGGHDGRIIPISSIRYGCSQSLMRNAGFEGFEFHPDLLQYMTNSMFSMLSDAAYPNWWILGYDSQDDMQMRGTFALGYAPYHFLHENELEWLTDSVKLLTADGVIPSRETIASRKYPYTTTYFAVIRADTPDNAPTRAIIEWLRSPAAQNAVEWAGFWPLSE